MTFPETEILCEYCGSVIEKFEDGWSFHWNAWGQVYHHDECLEMFEEAIYDD